MYCELVDFIKIRLSEEKEASKNLAKVANVKNKGFDEAYNLGREAAYEMALVIIENEIDRMRSKNFIKYDFTQAKRVKLTEKN